MPPARHGVPGDNWTTDAEELRQRVEAARLAAERDLNAVPPVRPKRSAPLPEGYSRVQHKMLIQRKPCDQGVSVFEVLNLYGTKQN